METKQRSDAPSVTCFLTGVILDIPLGTHLRGLFSGGKVDDITARKECNICVITGNRGQNLSSSCKG